MRFKEIRESDTNKPVEKKKPEKKTKIGRFEFKETITRSGDYFKGKGKKTKEAAKKVQLETWVSTKMLWKSSALLIANYFNSEYIKNLDFIFTKLKQLNNKKELSEKDIKVMEILVSLNELKYYVKTEDKGKEIDINLELIQRDFFISNIDEKIYQDLIKESDQKYHHSISYLFKIYGLLISFVTEEKTREIFYKAVVERNKDEEKSKKHPIVLNEKVIKDFGIKNYLSNNFKKKMQRYEY